MSARASFRVSLDCLLHKNKAQYTNHCITIPRAYIFKGNGKMPEQLLIVLQYALWAK